MTETLTTTADLAIDEAAADLLFRTARTAMQWTGDVVTDDEIEAAWSLAKFGPTAMNSLPLRFAIVRSDEAKARLVELMPDGNKAKVEAAPATLVLAYDPNFHEHMDTLFPHAPGIKEQFAPAAEMRDGMARTNALLQTGYLIVSLRAAGLATGPMHAADYAAVDAAFFAESGFKSFLVVNVGHAEGEGTAFPRLPRFELDEVAAIR
ncbi:malonic semialdehyde reductase [Xylanimonas allomyrinae]|uniref:Malonic semialdehyde reductase n=1 Tax=Xylanimonas allomyrinae TaxID=2509459 RepID=A0A4P6ENP4_9MICO|nr:malonic semialdehyde reductase [Xylanimonas allomyrinae]QAY64480.1 malonic semialdehyde reductase [Xylanimonas allomyrinae]